MLYINYISIKLRENESWKMPSGPTNPFFPLIIHSCHSFRLKKKKKNKQKALCYHQGNQSPVGYSFIVGWSVSPTITGISIVKLDIVCAVHVGKQKRLYGNGAGLGTINQVWSLLFKLATGVRLIIIEPYSNLFFSVPLIFC